MTVALAATYHDPDGRLHDQMVRVLPVLSTIFDGLAIQASPAAHQQSLALLTTAGALVQHDAFGAARPRRAAVQRALQFDAPFILYCDCDRALHWAERYPEELARVAASILDHDCTVLGRTPRAFRSHPRVQRDTEAIVNHVFSLVSGQPWDVTAAARGLSRRAVHAILDACPDDEDISTDVSWPLFLRRAGTFSLGYLATEGLEYETADRHGDAIAAAGSYGKWIDCLDADPRRWAHRLNLARIEIEAMLPYGEERCS